jgi:hypothetical protein
MSNLQSQASNLQTRSLFSHGIRRDSWCGRRLPSPPLGVRAGHSGLLRHGDRWRERSCGGRGQSGWRQRLFTTWDGTNIYLGWMGTWELGGTLHLKLGVGRRRPHGVDSRRRRGGQRQPEWAVRGVRLRSRE